jgi:hypothetical protein
MADDNRLTGQVPFDEEEDTDAELSTEAIEEENFEPRCACLLGV